MILLLSEGKIIKTLILKSKQYILGQEKLIKKIELIRGLYRYPNKMLGRNLTITHQQNNTDVLVFAAHPDDDVLGLGTTLYRHSLNNDNVKVIFVTNGTGRGGESWKQKTDESKKEAETRYSEAVQALTLISVPKEDIFCLGYPDGGTQRYLKSMSMDVHTLIQKLNQERIYVHCIEGGHDDHDITSFVVKSVCKKIGYSNVFEWTEYNPKQPLGAHNVKFLPSQSSELKEIKIEISKEERVLKRKMLASHHSQDVEQFYLQGEAIRKADTSNLDLELYKYCQFPIRKLQPMVKEFNESMLN